MIDTHAHLDGEEYADDRDAVVERARQAGVERIFIPAIDLPSVQTVMATCQRYEGYAFPMYGLHPEEVRADWQTVLSQLKPYLYPPHHSPLQAKRPSSSAQSSPLSSLQAKRPSSSTQSSPLSSQFSVGHPLRGLGGLPPSPIAIGEVGLDFYWSREFQQEQLAAFEEQVRWSVETRLPLMIHCRKAQNELVAILRNYEKDLPGGVFHCFTGNALEAEQLLQFDTFVLGIGGVLTFKKSPLPDMLPQHVPLSRIVLETDAPYMAPVPMRGKRNESAFVAYVLQRLAESYGVSTEEVERQTNANVDRVFGNYSHD